MLPTAPKQTICSYCGCACSLMISPQSSQPLPPQLQTNLALKEEKPCIKGLTLHQALTTNRLTRPQKRINKNSKDNRLENITWSQAYEEITDKLKQTIEKYGPETVYFTSSGELSNEVNYLIHILARLCGTNQVDSCARLCHAATGMAWSQTFGLKGTPENTFLDLKSADLYFYIGTDPAEDYPSMFQQVLKNKTKKGVTIISADVASNTTFQLADIKVLLQPTDIIPFISLIISDLLKAKTKKIAKPDKLSAFINKIETINQSIDKKLYQQYQIKKIVDLLSQAKKIAIGYGMGATQHLNGVDNVLAITDLAIITKAILMPGRGKVNVQGADDITQSFTKYDQKKELKYKAITQTLYQDKIKFLFVTGMNPIHSFPDSKRLRKKLKNIYVVYLHHHPSQTMKQADIVLPIPMLSEEEGTVTNAERRLKIIPQNNIICPSPHKIKPAYQTFYRLITTFQKSASPQNNLGLKRFLPTHSGSLKHVWPITKSWLKTNPLFKYSQIIVKDKNLVKTITQNNILANKTPKYKKVIPFKYQAGLFTKTTKLGRKPSNKALPFIFTTARSKHHFCTGEGTRNSSTLAQLENQAFAYLNSNSAKKLGLKNDDRIKISSTVGRITAPVRVVDLIADNTIVLPYHFEKPLVNRLTPLLIDPKSKTPMFKYVWVWAEKI